MPPTKTPTSTRNHNNTYTPQVSSAHNKHPEASQQHTNTPKNTIPIYTTPVKQQHIHKQLHKTHCKILNITKCTKNTLQFYAFQHHATHKKRLQSPYLLAPNTFAASTSKFIKTHHKITQTQNTPNTKPLKNLGKVKRAPNMHQNRRCPPIRSAQATQNENGHRKAHTNYSILSLHTDGAHFDFGHPTPSSFSHCRGGRGLLEFIVFYRVFR